MRPSLFARLLALSLTVAVAAVAGTAWVVTRTTSERLAGEFSRSLEADAFIYTQVLDHAMTHEDWSQAQPLLDELAGRTGRRVAVASRDGRPLADTADDGRGDPVPLPTVPAALIDPFAPLDGVAGPAGAADTPAPRAALLLDTFAPFPLVTAGIREERVAAADAVVDCLADAGHDVTVRDAAGTRPRVDAAEPIPPDVGDACGVRELGTRPTPTEERIHGEVRAAALRCLEAVGISGEEGLYALAAVEQLRGVDAVGFPRRQPAPVAPNLPARDDELPDVPAPADGTVAATDPVVAGCLATAYRDAYDPYVADPALLYIDDPGGDGVLAAAGGGRMLGAIGLVLTVVTTVTVVAGRRLVRPIRDLTTAALQMGEGDRSARVRVTGRDDVARLGTAFNEMASSVASQEQQRRAMVSDIAHELRTPLTTLRGYLEAAQDGVVALDDDLVASLLDESVLVQRLVEDLQQLALADAGRLDLHPEALDAVDLAEQVCAPHQRRAAAAGVDLEVVHDGPVPIHADPARLRQALGNLVTNALRHTPAGGSVRVTVARDGDRAVLGVADTGEGIAAEHLPHVFDRFYRADPSRSRETGGSGLGLAITRTLVEAHGGDVDVTSTVGQGATFTLRLPIGRDDRTTTCPADGPRGTCDGGPEGI